MTKAHTQGQWSIQGSKVVGNGYNIAHVNSHATSEGEANARLIASAPELLAALEVHHNTAMLNDPAYHGSQACKATMAAIRKAKGEV